MIANAHWSLRLVPLVDKAPLPLRISLQVENLTHPTAHAPEKIFSTNFSIISVAII